MKAYFFAFCPETGAMSDRFNYPADAEKAAIDMLKEHEAGLDILVCKTVLQVEHVDKEEGTYQVLPLVQ